jgi:hypothetical protein
MRGDDVERAIHANHRHIDDAINASLAHTVLRAGTAATHMAPAASASPDKWAGTCGGSGSRRADHEWVSDVTRWTMPRSPEHQFLRVALSGAVMALLIGGLLWLARGLVLVVAPPNTGAAPAVLLVQVGPVAQVAAAAPLPTIAQRHMVSPTNDISTHSSQPTLDSSTASSDTSVITAALSLADTALAAQLVRHLACLAPQAEHDSALDAQAAEMTLQEGIPVPSAGVIQVEGAQDLHILLSADALIDLRTQDMRCGETLVFGIPPLTWLPSDARFGLGVATNPSGAVVVIVIR